MTKAEVQEQAKALGLSGELRHLDSLKANPDNPRVMRDEKFTKLCNSIREFPKMMALRPMVFDESGTVLGGNMRLRALQELGYRFIPVEWAKAADALTDDEKRRFIIEDNVGFGDWDWDALANEWTDEPLGDWGLDTWSNDINLPPELDGVDLNPADLEKLQGDDETPAERIIIVFKNEQGEELARRLGTEYPFSKIVYTFNGDVIQ